MGDTLEVGSVKAERAKAWAAANPERRRGHKRKWNAANKAYYAERNAAIGAGERTAARRKRKFGTDGSDLLEEQGGACAICKTDLRELPPLAVHLDHCHVSGKARGMLCQKCNQGLGLFRDNVAFLEAAATYLKERN